MLKYVLIIFFTLTLYSQDLENKIVDIGQDLQVEVLKDDVYRIIHNFPFGCNSLLVKVDSAEFILVDTPFTNEATERLHNWMRDKFGEFKLKVINGHFHGDCLGGNDYFNSIGVPTYGSSLTKQLVEERGEESHSGTLQMLNRNEDKRYYNIMKDNVDAPPSNLFQLEDGLTFTYPNEEVEIYFPGHAHAPDNIVVYFKNKNVLFGGCMIKPLDNRSKGYVGAANFETWAGSVQNVMDRFGNAEIVMPGHGRWGDNSLLKHTYDIFK
ncbi:MAG: subclass B1 metallo-beta-lactamase [Bacteroidetes bacterium]|nr:subclass B1 metallo-beta-lactamase [Bacteroidota bacterium]